MKPIFFLITLNALLLVSACSQSENGAGSKDPSNPNAPAAGRGDISKDLTANLPDDQQIQKLMENYTKAVLEGNGALAAGLVTASTLEQYAGFYDKVLHANAEEVKAMDVADRINVLHCRMRKTLADMKKVKPESFFKDGVQGGYLDKASLGAGMKMGQLQVNGDKAQAHIILGDTRYQNSLLHFVKEKDGWKLDLAASNAGLSSALNSRAAERGDVDALIAAMMNGIEARGESVRKFSDAWKPLE